MSLLDEVMETCVFLNKQKVDDGYGGYKTEWTEGATFKAAIVFDTSIQARLAAVQGVFIAYILSQHSVISYLNTTKYSGE